MTPTPLVSVVMPSFNQAAFIRRSIESVFGQDYGRIELVVMDGGSTDGTVELLEQAARTHPELHWTSEPDNGPAHALNKALSRVRGVYVGWLNSDDLFMPGAVSRAVQAFNDHPDWIMCYGHGDHIDADDRRIGPYPTRTPDIGLAGFQHGCFICQPTMFFKQSMFTLLGPLDETLKTSFDYEYWLRAFRAFPDRIGFLDAVQAGSRLHDDCITMNMRRTIAVEGTRLSYDYLGRAETHWLTTYLEEVVNLPPDERGFDEPGRHVLELAEELNPVLDAGQVAWLEQVAVQLSGTSRSAG